MVENSSAVVLAITRDAQTYRVGHRDLGSYRDVAGQGMNGSGADPCR